MKKTWFAIFMAISLLSCNKENLESKLPVIKKPPVVNYLPVTVTLDENHPGYTIPATFEGLSYETGMLVDSPEFLNENNQVLIQLIKNLGQGILRIGGNTSDLTKVDWKPPYCQNPGQIHSPHLRLIVYRHLTRQ